MDIKGTVKEQRNELEKIDKKETLIPREGLREAHRYIKHPNILVITGIRRCGKSIFSYLLERNHQFGYVNFDDERLAGLKTEDLNKILESFYELYGDIEYIILDEPQNIKGWELFANRLRRTKKVVITGSNSKLLSGELATHLTGRYIDIRVFPFSFNEFLAYKKTGTPAVLTTLEKSNLLRRLNEYMENGGLPETYRFGSRMPQKIYEDIVTKDVILRHKIKKTEILRQLARYLISNSGEETTYTRLAGLFELKNSDTASKWVSYLEECFLIFRLERFDYKLKKQYIAPKKIYCVDTGIVNSVSTRFSENKGRLMENIVAVELKRRAERNNKEIYYWKNVLQHETDFVIKKDKSVEQLIQVTYANSPEEIKEREINSLLKASENLRCENLLIITYDYESTQKTKNKTIKYTPLWKWLTAADK